MVCYQILCETQQICHRDICFFTEAYGGATLSKTMVFKWHKEVQENVEDGPHSGRPISATNDQNMEVVRAVMAKHCRLSVGMIAVETGLDKNAVYRILADHLHM
jgi:hypothetical protein